MGYEVITIDGVKIDKSTKKFPVEVTTQTHALYGSQHTGVLDISQLPDSVMLISEHDIDPHTMMIDGRDVSIDGIKLDTIEEGAEVNNLSDQQASSLISGAQCSWHNHDSWYYRKTEISTSGLSSIHWDNLINIPETFTPSIHIHDDRYYTETEIDALLADIQTFGIKGGVDTYSDLPTTNSDNDIYIVRTTVDSYEEGFYQWDSNTLSWIFLANNTGASHTHDDRYFTETEITTNYYSKSDIDDMILTISQKNELISGLDTNLHTHDDRYFTETEITTILSGYSLSTHTHDTRYYTKTELDTLFASVYTKNEVNNLISSITYETISNNDPTTDITATELETLTDGSNADSLHTHSNSGSSDDPTPTSGGLDSAYDNFSSYSQGTGREINVDFGPVQLTASENFAPLRLTAISYVPTQWLGGGEICFYDNEMFYRDATRSSWLSFSTFTIGAGSSTSNLKESYLDVFDSVTMNSSNGWVAPFNGTIVTLSISSNTVSYNAIEVRINGTTSSAKLWYSSSTKAYSSTLNAQFSAGDILSFYAAGTSGGTSKPIVMAIIRRRL